MRAAGLPLQPGLGAVLHVAREEIVAGAAILIVGLGERRYGAAGPGRWVFPRHADVLAAFGQHLADGGAGDGEVTLRRRLARVLGRAFDRAGGLAAVFRKQAVELVGEA